MMIENLVNILKNKNEIDGWKIFENKRESYELYFIRRNLEMNRAKNIHTIEVTVYKDFDENGTKLKGLSSTKIHPTMTEEEVHQTIDDAIYACQFAKNAFYPLVKPSDEALGKIISNLDEKPLIERLNDIVEAVFKADVYDKGSINSTELFLSKLNNRILNSEGIDYSYEKYAGEVEFITNWKEDKEEIELFKHLNFGNFDAKQLTEEVEQMLQMSQGRANAKPMPNLGAHTVFLTGESVPRFLQYYTVQSNTAYVYEKFSTAKVNESIQGDEIIGDKISFKLNPLLPGSSLSYPVDEDGIVLKEVQVIEDGILKQYWGAQRQSYYLDVLPTGNITNMEFSGGKHSIDELKKEPYLEVISFSSFQVDYFTGDFGGEVRLGLYFDGEKVTPVSGGSVTGSLKQAQKEMYLSKEMASINYYCGPKFIQIKNVSVAGNE